MNDKGFLEQVALLRLARVLVPILLVLSMAAMVVIKVFGADNATTTPGGPILGALQPEQIAFLGVTIGIFFRTLLPYLQTRDAATGEFHFNSRFLGTAVSAFLLSGISSALLFPSFAVPGVGSTLAIFLASFSWGFTTNDILNGFSKPTTTVTTTPT